MKSTNRFACLLLLVLLLGVLVLMVHRDDSPAWSSIQPEDVKAEEGTTTTANQTPWVRQKAFNLPKKEDHTRALSNVFEVRPSFSGAAPVRPRPRPTRTTIDGVRRARPRPQRSPDNHGIGTVPTRRSPSQTRDDGSILVVRRRSRTPLVTTMVTSTTANNIAATDSQPADISALTTTTTIETSTVTTPTTTTATTSSSSPEPVTTTEIRTVSSTTQEVTTSTTSTTSTTASTTTTREATTPVFALVATTSEGPSIGPSSMPTPSPSDLPSSQPSLGPSSLPSPSPTTSTPSQGPSISPSSLPSPSPSSEPTDPPTNGPTFEPTESPTSNPTNSPTLEPTTSPTTTRATYGLQADCAIDDPDRFNICLDISSVSGKVEPWFEDVMRAKTLYENLINQDLGGPFQPPSSFGAVATKVPDFIDDLYIAVIEESIDGQGKAWGAAGPTLLPGGKVQAGRVRLDTADIKTAKEFDAVFPLMVHEIAHILGFGIPAILEKKNLLDSSGEYQGPSVRAFWDQIGCSGPVPFAPNSAHWVAGCVGREIMSPSLMVKPVSWALSGLTTGALEDLGYSINRDFQMDYGLEDLGSQCGSFCPERGNGIRRLHSKPQPSLSAEVQAQIATTARRFFVTNQSVSVLYQDGDQIVSHMVHWGDAE